MSAESMNSLADQYTLSNGLVNYHLLFRSFLTNTGADASSINKRSLSASASLSRMHSLPSLSHTMGSSSSSSANLGAVHPWEFNYTRSKHQEHPYWQSATAQPKTVVELYNTTNKYNTLIPSGTEKSADELNTNEKSLLLSQYNNIILLLCNKCYKLFLSNWRTIRNLFKKQSITGHKGCILINNFISILESQGIMLSKTELGLIVKNFRGVGVQDIVLYDDFLRVCMLVKDHYK
jgi:hypothetical protein